MKDAVKEKEIKFILHFTRISNLDSILTHGLISRQDLETNGMQFDFNDDDRHDCQENAICCSLGYPNYKMFYSLRQNNPDIKWVVLAIEPSVLWEKDCAFCVSNAASNEATCIPISDRKGLVAFKKIFEEIEGKPTRAELGLATGFPTNPQAEILVFDRIEAEHIIRAITEDKATEKELETKYSNWEFLCDREFFYPRRDHEHW